MIRTIKLLAGALLLAAGTSAGATTVTFSGFAGGPSYSALGVTITAEGQNLLALDSPNGTTGIIGDGSPRPALTAVFDVLTSSVSVDLGDFGSDPDELFLQAFGLGGVPLGESSLLISSSDASMHTLSISTSGISYVVFGSRSPSLNGSSVYADNLTFDAPVPEPGTWAMMIAGFAALGWRIRRQRRELGKAITS
jgi:hypothetical protein